MQRSLSLFARALIVIGVVFAVACGGGGSGGLKPGSNDSYKDPLAFTRTYYTVLFGTFSGTAEAGKVMNLFEDSCREKVKIEDVSKGIEKLPVEFPKLKGVKFDDVDFGNKAVVKKTDSGATVTTPAVKDIRVRADGKWVNAYEFFQPAGVVDEDDRDDTEDEELVFANGRYYIGDCDILTGLAREGAPATPTSTPRVTATPARTTVTPTPAASTASRTPTPGVTVRVGTPSVASNLSNSEVEAYTKKYWLMVFGVYTGNLKAEDVMAFYTPDCQSQVKAADVTGGLSRLTSVYPKLKGEKLEDIDFQGKLKISKLGTGFSTEMPGAKDMKIKVNGQWQEMFPYMRNVGLIGANDSGTGGSPQNFIGVGGKLYDEDCVFLKNVASK